MSFYGGSGSYIQAEEHDIYDEHVTTTVRLVQMTMPSTLLPPQPEREGLYAQDQYAASVGAGYNAGGTVLSLDVGYRLGNNMIIGSFGAPKRPED
jgi:hypothetical protein